MRQREGKGRMGRWVGQGVSNSLVGRAVRELTHVVREPSFEEVRHRSRDYPKERSAQVDPAREVDSPFDPKTWISFSFLNASTSISDLDATLLSSLYPTFVVRLGREESQVAGGTHR